MIRSTSHSRENILKIDAACLMIKMHMRIFQYSRGSERKELIADPSENKYSDYQGQAGQGPCSGH